MKNLAIRSGLFNLIDPMTFLLLWKVHCKLRRAEKGGKKQFYF